MDVAELINPSRVNNRVRFVLLLLPPSDVFDAIPAYAIRISRHFPIWSWDQQSANCPAYAPCPA